MKSINRKDFGLLQHKVRQFAATFPAGSTVEDIESSESWENVATGLGLEAGSDIRVMIEDFSAIHYGIVTYAKGTTVKIKVITSHQLDEVVASDDEGEYFPKMCGPKKWCVIKRSDASVVKELIPTKADALTAIDELIAELK